MKRKIFILGAALLLLVTVSAAQRRGNAGMAGSQSGQHGATGKQGQRQMGSGLGTRDEQRLRIHATDQQRQQLRDCTKSADRIRTRAREITRQFRNASVTPAQAMQWREQLRNDLQAMNENYELFMNDLSEEQQLAAQQTIEQIEQSRTQLLEFAELLDNELIAPELQHDRIRDQAQDTERAADQLKKHQTELAVQFNK